MDVSTGYSYLDSEITEAAYNAVAQEGKPLPFVAKTVLHFGLLQSNASIDFRRWC